MFHDTESEIVRLCRSSGSNMSIMHFEGLGKEYYQEDDDRLYDIPIDPIWEAQQMNTFTAWCNAHLRNANMQIEVFDQDFRNGLRLMKLLEIIGNAILPPPDKGKMRFHKIANVNKALKFIESKGVKIDSVGAEEIVDGNIKMTLGMIWTIILRFTIQDILVEDSSAKEGLLLWCKRKTNGYKNIRVENFKSSFQNGLVFCALIHSHDPKLIDYDSLSQNNVENNLNLAFTVAEKELDVPQMLSVEEMIKNDISDERSIMAYVSSYYHTFNKRDKIDAAISNINGIISPRIEENKYEVDYENLADQLLKWIDSVSVEFENRSDVNDHSDMLSKVKWFEEYKFVDKPKNVGVKLKLQYKSINNKYFNEKADLINIRWNTMEQLELLYEKHLSDQQHREEHINNLLKKFDINFQFQRAWVSDQIEQLVSRDYETSNISQLRTLARCQDNFIATVGSHQSRTDKLVSISSELRRLRYVDMKTINEKVELIVSHWDSLGGLHDQRVRFINIYVNALAQIDDLQLDFANRVVILYNWIQQANQDLNDKFLLHFIDEIKDLISAQESFKRTVSEAIDELNVVKSLEDRMANVFDKTGIKSFPRNPYTDITMNDLQKAWIQLESRILDRDNFLRESLAERVVMKECHLDYINRLEKISVILGAIQDSLFNKSSPDGRVENRVMMLKQLQSQLNSLTTPLRDVDIIYQKLDNYSKLDCSLSILSFEQIVIIHNILGYLLSEALRLCSLDRIDDRSTNNLPNNKIHEYEACFRHFDRYNSGQLDANQFRACLVSLGFALEEDKNDDSSFDQILSKVDRNRSGFVSLKNYLDFMVQQNDFRCNSERLAESFRILSNNQLWITRDRIRQELPSPVANYCLKNMKPLVSSTGDGEVCLDYNDFVARLYDGKADHARTAATQ